VPTGAYVITLPGGGGSYLLLPPMSVSQMAKNGIISGG
jgi:hypothetical protein